LKCLIDATSRNKIFFQKTFLGHVECGQGFEWHADQGSSCQFKAWLDANKACSDLYRGREGGGLSYPKATRSQLGEGMYWQQRLQLYLGGDSGGSTY